MLYAAIEAGGTKFICAVADENLNIIETISVNTTTPKETLAKVFSFFDKYKITSIGIGSFGPIDLNKSSLKYGYILNTPKSGWKNFNFVGSIQDRYNVPIMWTTDVNAANYGEYKLGAAKDNLSSVYLTVGTGVGGGAIFNERILDGLSHPEMGHILIRKHPDDNFEGACPYHSNCLEGLASGYAIQQRFSKEAYTLDSDDPFWDIEAYYLAQGIMNYTLILSPEKIILGGGVMKQEHLIPLIEKHLDILISDYVDLPLFSNYVSLPALGNDAGIIGCLLLAKDVFYSSNKETSNQNLVSRIK